MPSKLGCCWDKILADLLPSFFGVGASDYLLTFLCLPEAFFTPGDRSWSLLSLRLTMTLQTFPHWLELERTTGSFCIHCQFSYKTFILKSCMYSSTQDGCHFCSKTNKQTKPKWKIHLCHSNGKGAAHSQEPTINRLQCAFWQEKLQKWSSFKKRVLDAHIYIIFYPIYHHSCRTTLALGMDLLVSHLGAHIAVFRDFLNGFGPLWELLNWKLLVRNFKFG